MKKHQRVKYESGQLEQLCSIADHGVTYDGDLISKVGTEKLYKAGLVYRVKGWTILTVKGLTYLFDLGLLRV